VHPLQAGSHSMIKIRVVTEASVFGRVLIVLASGSTGSVIKEVAISTLEAHV